MSDIALATARRSVLNQNVLNSMFSLRYRVFYERLNWDVPVIDGMETDQFDDLNPTYILALNGNEAEGCWRILPTTGSYMLSDVFPELLRGELAPCDSSIMEISRFAVSPTDKHDLMKNTVNSITFKMIRNVFDYAMENGISNYVAVMSVSLERLLLRLGIPVRRFGDKAATKIGRVTSVACWIDINEQFFKAVYPTKFPSSPRVQRLHHERIAA